MLSSVEATFAGGLLPLFSQYRTDRGWHPAARARSACVSPASIRAARIWRPETMLPIARLYMRFCWRYGRVDGCPGVACTSNLVAKFATSDADKVSAVPPVAVFGAT